MNPFNTYIDNLIDFPLPHKIVFLCIIAKVYAHDLVHVEMWIGDGEKTIGARWKRGKYVYFSIHTLHIRTQPAKSLKSNAGGVSFC